MRFRSFALATLMVMASLTTMVSADTVTTQDVEISGNYTMTGNYTVSHGTTLTIKPGSVVDMQDYWMKVEGNLVASQSTIMSSIQTTGQGSHNAGVWDGLTIEVGGSADLDDVTISNGKTCLMVHGTVDADSLNLEDCLIGAEAHGSLSIDDLDAQHIDHDGVRVTGSADISGAYFLDMTGGISSSGTLTMENSQFESVGIGITLSGGSAMLDDAQFNSGVSVGLSLSNNVSGYVDGLTGTAGDAIHAFACQGITVSDVDMSGQRLVNSWGAGDLTIQDVSFTSNSPETPIDVRTSGTVTLSDIKLNGSFSSMQGSHDAPWIGMALSGSGDYILSDLDIESTDTSLVATGTGVLSITDSQFTSEENGLVISGLTEFNIESTTVNISLGGGIGIDILQGSNNFDNVEVNMPYFQFESGSTGIQVWWGDVDAGTLSVNGFATGIDLQSSLMEVEDLTMTSSSEVNLNLDDSSIEVTGALQTSNADVGLHMSESTATIRSLTSSLHDNGIESDNSETVIWSWSVANNLISDSTGTGSLWWGSSQYPDVHNPTNERLWEMSIDFEDLSGNSVDASWESMGFTGTASLGNAMVPAPVSGTTVLAYFGGVGVATEVIGTEGGSATIQVPIMPQGDWTISGTTTISLGSTEDGSPHMAGGNITVTGSATLLLSGSSLQLPEGAVLKTMNNGHFGGDDGTLIGDVVLENDRINQNSDSGNLTIIGATTFSGCQTSTSVNNLNLQGDVNLGNSCNVVIQDGSLSGLATTGIGAVLEIRNTLDVTVLDKGEPVQGVSVSVQGQSATTDVNGQVSRTATALRVDSSGVMEQGIVPVTMQWGSITDMLGWDTSSSLEHTFMASTIQGGTLTEWLILEKAWSPYYLSSDLVVPFGQTMTVNDGVALRVANGVTISVEGDIVTGYSTISSTGGGARWGGLFIGDNAETSAVITGTNLVEGSPLLTVNGLADVVVSNALISRSSGAEPLVRLTSDASGEVQIVSTTLSDSASYCIEAQGNALLSLHDLTAQSCADSSLWARSTEVAIDGFVESTGVDLGAVQGTISNLNGSELMLYNNDGLEMNSLSLTSIVGADNRYISIDGAEVNGAPAVDLDNSAGDLSGIVIDCGGVGTGLIAHHGRASAAIIVSDSSITNCTKGIDLHTDGESATFELRDVSIDSSTVVSSDGNNLLISDGSLIGNLEVANSRADLHDVSPSQTTTDNAQVFIWSSHVFDVRLDGSSHVATIMLTVPEMEWQSTFTGSTQQVSVPHTIINDNGTTLSDTVDISATASNLPAIDTNAEIGSTADEVIQINLVSNQAPEVLIVEPDEGDRVMEGEAMEVKALITDDLDSNEELTIEWSVVFAQTVVFQVSGESNYITDLPAGGYTLNLDVTDKQGLTTSKSIYFEVTMLDSDDDWISSCDEDSWFDKEQNRKCGPDVYDNDDDNDGVFDARDPWPTDPCASIDTDGDGQPDDLHCPPGMETWLVEDPDDDGDGTPDSLESSNDDSESGTAIGTIVFVIILLAAGAFMILRRKQGVN